MFWNEKIDTIKKKYSVQEFAVPQVKRKEILRKIESKFIKRDKDYFHPNNTDVKFNNWWDNLAVKEIIKTNQSLSNFLKNVFSPTQKNWLACEFPNQVYIYQSKLNPATDLVSIGLGRTSRYYFIDLKYEYLIGFEIQKDGIEVRFSGNNKGYEKIKKLFI